MKSIALALASILAITASAWAAPASTPLTLTHSQLVEIVQNADADLSALPGFVGAHIVLDLRKIPLQPYFAAAGHPHGLVFTCQISFEDDGGGPVTATLLNYEVSEDGRDFVKLGGCTALER